MERYSDNAIEIINELHKERLDYESEYLHLIDAAMRLAAYEDTGLEPEEVRAQKSLFDYIVPDCGLSDGVRRFQHFRDLVQAEQDGRLVVLPCSMENPVYVIAKCKDVVLFQERDTGAIDCPFEADCLFDVCEDDHVNIFETTITGYSYREDDFGELEMFLENIKFTFTEKEIGKTVFLTREEAEAALEGIAHE